MAIPPQKRVPDCRGQLRSPRNGKISSQRHEDESHRQLSSPVRATPPVLREIGLKYPPRLSPHLLFASGPTNTHDRLVRFFELLDTDLADGHVKVLAETREKRSRVRFVRAYVGVCRDFLRVHRAIV